MPPVRRLRSAPSSARGLAAAVCSPASWFLSLGVWAVPPDFTTPAAVWRIPLRAALSTEVTWRDGLARRRLKPWLPQSLSKIRFRSPGAASAAARSCTAASAGEFGRRMFFRVLGFSRGSAPRARRPTICGSELFRMTRSPIGSRQRKAWVLSALVTRMRQDLWRSIS